MRDIGTTLREARLRARVDITQVEMETKIRAKYLRALENEEWDLLPGPTFVKTFLRTYADYLGLDARLLVEEYRRRFETPAPAEMTPFAPHLSGKREPFRPPGLPRGVVVGMVFVGLLGALFLLGSIGGDEPERAGEDAPATTATQPEQRAEGSGRANASDGGRRSRVVSLRVVPTGQVWVCLMDASGNRLIDGREVGPGEDLGPWRSRRFRITLGNGQARLRINGTDRAVTESAQPIGYDIRRGSRDELGEGSRPTCP
jgi:cytoskeleton protein RodZ